jgi:outer membrane protein assembly factor BamB
LLLVMVCLCLCGPTRGAAGFGAAGSHWLVSKPLLDHAGLTLVWQTTLPVGKGERLEHMVLLDNRLYLRSSRNYTWSLEREDGEMVFGRAIAAPGIPVLGWVAHGNSLISVIGGQLVEFDIDTGLERRITDLELSIVAPPVRNERFFYVSGADRRLHTLRVKDMVQTFEVAARNESLITSVLADEEMVVFGTDEGNLIAAMADAPRMLWQFDAVEAMAGPVLRDGYAFYFANKDTNVYRVDMVDATTATLTWKRQMEAVLDRAPRLTLRAVYQHAPGRGLTAIDKESGRVLWTVPKGLDLLAETDGRAYVMTEQRTLVVMDNLTGRKLYRVNFAPVANHANNVTDANIYICGERGRVACLRPVQ